MKPTYRKSQARNLLMQSDLAMDPSLEVKRWFTGFVELSFQWIQICIDSLMNRSSNICVYLIVGVALTAILHFINLTT